MTLNINMNNVYYNNYYNDRTLTNIKNQRLKFSSGFITYIKIFDRMLLIYDDEE